MLRKIYCLVLVCFSLAVFKADVTAEEASARQKEWNPSSAGPVTAWTAPLCGKGKFVIQPFLFYNRTRGSFNSDGHYDSLAKGDKKYQYQQQLFAQYGITDKLEIDGQIVYQENYIKQGNSKAHSSGLGDSYLFLRYCAFEENGWLPHITSLLQLKMPTGKYQHLDPDKLGIDSMGATSGGGSWDPGLGINLTKKFKPFIFHTDVTYNFPQQVRVDGAKIRYANYLNYDVGVEYFLSRGLNLMLEVNGFRQGDKKEDGIKTPDSAIDYLTVSPGIGWSNDKIQMLVAYQRVILGANTDANDSIVLTCVYSF
jgi:opacity protein-like surface antigen